MKKPYVIGAVVVVIIIILSVVGIYFQVQPQKVDDASSLSLANSSLTLTTIRTDVFAQVNGDKNGVLVASSSVLSQNDGVKTGASGRALLENNDFKTTIDHDTEISVKEVNQKQAKLVLNSGSVWLRVQKVFGAGEGVEVETGNAVAAVRGTSFGLFSFQGISTLLVVDGTVGFRAVGSSTAEETAIHAGEKAIIGKDGKVVITALTDKDKNSEWFKFNNPPGSEDAGILPPSSPSATTTIQNPNIPPVGTSSSTPASTSSQSGGNGNNSGPPAPSYPRIRITSVSPSTVTSQPATILVNGDGFESATRLIVGDVRLQFEIISDSQVRFTLNQMAEGTYDLKISNPDSAATLGEAITIRKNQGQ